MSLISELQNIIDLNYDIVDLESFSKIYSKNNDISEEEIMNNFKIIESSDKYPVSEDMLYSLKKSTIKSLEKNLNLSESEYINKENKNYFTYCFYKKFASIVSKNIFIHLDTIEKIFIIDFIKRQSVVHKPKSKNIYIGMIVKYTEIVDGDELETIDYIKIKKSNLSEMYNLVKDKEIIRQFTFDDEVDKVKPFNKDIKMMFTSKLNDINEQSEFDIKSKNLEIERSLIGMPKEEKIMKEKEMLLKHVKITAKSLKISSKSNKIQYMQHKNFDISDILNIVYNNILTFNSVEIMQTLEQLEPPAVDELKTPAVGETETPTTSDVETTETMETMEEEEDSFMNF
jgi:hypothetical protein